MIWKTSKNKITQFHSISKEDFSEVHRPMKKLLEKCRMPWELFWRKITFLPLFISAMVNTISVSVLFESTPMKYFCEVNIECYHLFKYILHQFDLYWKYKYSNKYCHFSLVWTQKRYEGHTISFQTFFVRPFKFVVDSWKFTMLLLYILWDNWPIFMISGLNE